MEPEGGDFVADGVDVAEGDGAHDDDVESGTGIRQTRTTYLPTWQLAQFLTCYGLSRFFPKSSLALSNSAVIPPGFSFNFLICWIMAFGVRLNVSDS